MRKEAYQAEPAGAVEDGPLQQKKGGAENHNQNEGKKQQQGAMGYPTPLTSILSSEGKVATPWTCLVCSETNKHEAAVCFLCRRTRIPKWLHTESGKPAVPGAVIQTPPRCTSLPIGDCLMVAHCVGIKPDLLETPPLAGPPRPPCSIACFGIVRNNDISSQEEQPGQQECDSSSSRASLLEVVIPVEEISLLTVLAAGTEANAQAYRQFLSFGFCPQCTRTFNIQNGPGHLLIASERAELSASLAKVGKLLADAFVNKAVAKNGAVVNKAEVLRSTQKIKDLQAQEEKIKRRLERPVLSCPHCAWRP